MIHTAGRRRKKSEGLVIYFNSHAGLVLLKISGPLAVIMPVHDPQQRIAKSKHSPTWTSIDAK